jgi:hypothetical protein
MPMAIHQPKYSKEEFAQRGDEIYESQVRQQVEAGNQGKVVAIDLESGAFEVDNDEIAACDRLESKYPNAQIWIVRIASFLESLWPVVSHQRAEEHRSCAVIYDTVRGNLSR